MLLQCMQVAGSGIVLVADPGTPLNGHPSIADTHDITDNSEVPTVFPFTSILKQPLNSGHPATPYKGQFLRSRLHTNNT